MSTKKSNKNYLEEKNFVLKTKAGDIKLNPYSFSVKIKLMKSGIMDKMLGYYNSINESGVNLDKKVKEKDQKKLVAATDFIKYGELLESLVDAVWIMAPKDVELQGKDKLINNVIESEIYNFMSWLIAQLKDEQDFLAPGGRKGAKKQG